MSYQSQYSPEQQHEAQIPPRGRILEVQDAVLEIESAFEVEFGAVPAQKPVDERRVSNHALKNSIVFDPQQHLLQSTREQLNDIYN